MRGPGGAHVITLRDVVLLAWDDVGALDATPNVCPRLADLRLEAVNYTRAFANPVCSQSRAVVLFGAQGRTFGTTCDLGGLAPGPVLPPASWPTLPGLLRWRGWRTHHVGKWHCGANASGASSPVGPVSRGYDAWRAGTPLNLDGGGGFYDWQRHDADEVSHVVSVESRYATLAQLDEVAGFWAEPRTAPRFLSVALNEAHAPYSEVPASLLDGWPPPELGDPPRKRYLAKLRAADTALGRVLDLPGMHNALVVLWSDNGTAARSAGTSANPDHQKGTTYDPGIRVPLVVRWPGCPVGEDEGLRHLVDVAPLVAENLGLPRPAEWDGTTAARSSIISEATMGGTLDQCVRTETHKLRAVRNEPDPRQEQLFDLVEDPGELEPLDLEDPAHAELLEDLRFQLYGMEATP